MTDEELKQLVASLAIAQRQTSEELKQLAKDTDKELKQLLASQQATDWQIQQTDAELKQLAATTAAQFRDTDRKIKELGKQIGGLGEKFGSFTEGMAFPSMRKILAKNFGIERIAPRYEAHKNGRCIELDVFGYSNGIENKAVIVEIKSHLRDDHIERLLQLLKEVKEFLPEHANKTFYGIMAVVDASEHLKHQVLTHGLYYAEVHNNTFKLKIPPGFQARAF